MDEKTLNGSVLKLANNIPLNISFGYLGSADPNDRVGFRIYLCCPKHSKLEPLAIGFGFQLEDGFTHREESVPWQNGRDKSTYRWTMSRHLIQWSKFSTKCPTDGCNYSIDIKHSQQNQSEFTIEYDPVSSGHLFLKNLEIFLN